MFSSDEKYLIKNIEHVFRNETIDVCKVRLEQVSPVMERTLRNKKMSFYVYSNCFKLTKSKVDLIGAVIKLKKIYLSPKVRNCKVWISKEKESKLTVAEKQQTYMVPVWIDQLFFDDFEIVALANNSNIQPNNKSTNIAKNDDVENNDIEWLDEF